MIVPVRSELGEIAVYRLYLVGHVLPSHAVCEKLILGVQRPFRLFKKLFRWNRLTLPLS
jgi:hypothetical protein